MFQTRIDKIIDGKFNEESYPPSDFENKGFILPLIKKFEEKDVNELQKELLKIERSLKLICYDFRDIKNKDLDFLRKFVLLLQIINKILEKALNTDNLNFSWQDIISNLLHIDNNPELMIKSMLRELKRKNSFNVSILAKKLKRTETPKYSYGIIYDSKQRLISAFL